MNDGNSLDYNVVGHTTATANSHYEQKMFDAKVICSCNCVNRRIWSSFANVSISDRHRKNRKAIDSLHSHARQRFFVLLMPILFAKSAASCSYSIHPSSCFLLKSFPRRNGNVPHTNSAEIQHFWTSENHHVKPAFKVNHSFDFTWKSTNVSRNNKRATLFSTLDSPHDMPDDLNKQTYCSLGNTSGGNEIVRADPIVNSLNTIEDDQSGSNIYFDSGNSQHLALTYTSSCEGSYTGNKHYTKLKRGKTVRGIHGRDEEATSNVSRNELQKNRFTDIVDTMKFRKQFDKRVENHDTYNADKVTSDVTKQTALSSSRPQTRTFTERIDKIKKSVSLIDVIESYNLSKFTRVSAHSAKACCPFHDDHNPSLSIDDRRGLYKCFVCGAGGDMFNFIREFTALSVYTDKKKKEKMSYIEAVKLALKEFVDFRISNDVIRVEAEQHDNDINEMSSKKFIDRKIKSDRIRQTNSFAAAFYIKCLVTLPTAGKARAHLRLRSINPESISTFVLGYAPDCYYGSESKIAESESRSLTEGKEYTKKRWGEGSLVEYLSGEGFSPSEILESGLAICTRGQYASKHSRICHENNSLNQTSCASDDGSNNDYSYLMDRFRNRLVVPIFDEKGEHIIGFGGRLLQTSHGNNKDESTHIAPKYINSPESVIFSKKSVLFNAYRAKLAIASSSNGPPPPLIIVEGFFDVLTLSNVGLRNVVASMGTALSEEQLNLAASIAEVPGGRIIICMDNDDAGQKAIERICRSSVLTNLSEITRNQLFIATVPGEVKDPAEYIDHAGGGKKSKLNFESQVLSCAQPWDEWFIEKLLMKYDSKDETGSFSVVCDEVSSFLSTYFTEKDRAVRAHKIADDIAKLKAKNSDYSSRSLEIIRTRLASDIIDMSTRKAAPHETMSGWLGKIDELSSELSTGDLKFFARCEAASNDEEGEKLKRSKNATVGVRSPRHVIKSNASIAIDRLQTVKRRIGPMNQRAVHQVSQTDIHNQQLVPHFHGFTFKNKSDRDWLGLSGSGNTRAKMYLGSISIPMEENDSIRASTPLFNRPNKSWKKEEVVYFNSNEYLGKRFLSPDAVNAGYERGDDKPLAGESLLDFMEKKLFERNEDLMILQAESRLLHALAKFPQARGIMRTVYSSATFGPLNMKWTSEDRQWLFQCLTGSPEINPPLSRELLDGGTSLQLRFNLANRNDCPQHAFHDPHPFVINNESSKFVKVINSEVENAGNLPLPNGDGNSIVTQNTAILLEKTDSSHEGRPEALSTNKPNGSEELTGSLDEFFQPADDLFPCSTGNHIAKEARPELTVQESVAALLRATAMKRFSTAKSKFSRIVYEMDRRSIVDDRQDNSVSEELSKLSSEELRELFERVGIEVIDAQKSLYDSDRSTDRVNSQLLDHSMSGNVHYRVSQAELQRLDKMMEDHIASLPNDCYHPETPGDKRNYFFGVDEVSDQLDSRYGGRDSDKFVISGLTNGELNWA